MLRQVLAMALTYDHRNFGCCDVFCHSFRHWLERSFSGTVISLRQCALKEPLCQKFLVSPHGRNLQVPALLLLSSSAMLLDGFPPWPASALGIAID